MRTSELDVSDVLPQSSRVSCLHFHIGRNSLVTFDDFVLGVLLVGFYSGKNLSLTYPPVLDVDGMAIILYVWLAPLSA